MHPPPLFHVLLPFRTELDARGLLPLATARSILRAAEPNPATREAADRTFAAVVSLADVAELIAATSHLTWEGLVPGRSCLALVQRYGEPLVAWIRSRVRDGILPGTPDGLGECLVELRSVEALQLLLEIDGYAGDSPRSPRGQRFSLLHAWVQRDPIAATLPVFDRAKAGEGADDDPHAALLRMIVRAGPASAFARIGAARGAEAGTVFERFGLPRALTPELVLDVLDRAAASERGWPRFAGTDDRDEYFGLRLVVARQRGGDAWSVVLERLQGADPQGPLVERRIYDGTGGAAFEQPVPVQIEQGTDGTVLVRTAAVSLKTSAEDLVGEGSRATWSTTPAAIWTLRRAAIRALLAAHPTAVWPPVADTLADLAIPDPEAIVVSTGFEHVEGGDFLPSASSTYRSAVEALVDGDSACFEAGPANTDWRRHARHPEASGAR